MPRFRRSLSAAIFFRRLRIAFFSALVSLRCTGAGSVSSVSVFGSGRLASAFFAAASLAAAFRAVLLLALDRGGLAVAWVDSGSVRCARISLKSGSGGSGAATVVCREGRGTPCGGWTV